MAEVRVGPCCPTGELQVPHRRGADARQLADSGRPTRIEPGSQSAVVRCTPSATGWKRRAWDKNSPRRRACRPTSFARTRQHRSVRAAFSALHELNTEVGDPDSRSAHPDDAEPLQRRHRRFPRRRGGHVEDGQRHLDGAPAFITSIPPEAGGEPPRRAAAAGKIIGAEYDARHPRRRSCRRWRTAIVTVRPIREFKPDLVLDASAQRLPSRPPLHQPTGPGCRLHGDGAGRRAEVRISTGNPVIAQAAG